jgi:lysozyme family protein
MMTIAERATEFVLHHEDEPGTGKITSDTGGRTRYGISERSYPNAAKEIFTLPNEKARSYAKDFYIREFWNNTRLPQVKSYSLASKIMDMSVNMGAPRATKIVQMCCGLEMDGAFGSKTVAALNAAAPKELLLKICAAQEAYYRHLADVNPEKYSKFVVTKDGDDGHWIRRARAFEED